MARNIDPKQPVRGQEGRCLHCWNKRDQLARHIHFLQFGDEGSLGGHLSGQLGEKGELDGQIGAIIAWVHSLRQSYQGRVDDMGRPLPVWEAWLLAHGATEAMVNRFRR